MTVTPATFVETLPEFANSANYPTSAITTWLAIGGLQLTDRWGVGATVAVNPPTTLYDWGLTLFAAHNLSLEFNFQKQAAAGSAPGGSTGPVSAQAVGAVSRSYDVEAAIIAGGGDFNLTVYGTRFMALVKIMGGGPVDVGGGCNPDPFSGQAWPGPPPFPGWFC